MEENKRRTFGFLGILLFAAGCGNDPPPAPPQIPTAPVASATVPTTPANPWPAFRAVPSRLSPVPYEAPAAVNPAGSAIEPILPETPTAPTAPTVSDGEIRRLLRGRWVLRETSTTSDGGTVVSECTLTIGRRDSGTEQCITRTTPGAGVRNCAPQGQSAMEFISTAPYTVTVNQGVVNYAPGPARVLRDTTCNPVTTTTHTTMRGTWVSSDELVIRTIESDGSESANTSTYTRFNPAAEANPIVPVE